MEFKEIEDIEIRIEKAKETVIKTNELLKRHEQNVENLELKKEEVKNKIMMNFILEYGISPEMLYDTFKETLPDIDTSKKRGRKKKVKQLIEQNKIVIADKKSSEKIKTDNADENFNNLNLSKEVEEANNHTDSYEETFVDKTES